MYLLELHARLFLQSNVKKYPHSLPAVSFTRRKLAFGFSLCVIVCDCVCVYGYTPAKYRLVWLKSWKEWNTRIHYDYGGKWSRINSPPVPCSPLFQNAFHVIYAAVIGPVCYLLLP